MSGGFGYRILDRFCLTHEGRDIAVRGQKQRALLAAFCLGAPARQSRDRLADLLWSDSGPDKARGSLRNTLHILARETAPLELFEAGRQEVQARFSGACCDLEGALRAWDAGQEAALAARSLRDAEMRFAADLWGLDPVFDSFLTERRAVWLGALAGALRTRLALPVTAAGRSPRLIAERLRELMPQDEAATRTLMQLDIAAGNKAAALDHYRLLWEVLEEEFDIEPSPETQAIAVSLKMAPSNPAAGPLPDPAHRGGAPRREAEAERLTIFLHPFPLLGLPEEDQIRVAAMQAELSAALFAVEDWVTIETAPGMALPCRDGHYELRGTASPGIEEMRLILTLKDLATGTIIWTWPLQLHREDWLRNSGFALQRMALRLTGKLEAHYIAGIDRLSDAELADYRKLIRAGWLMRDWSAEADRRAEVLLRSVGSAGDLGLRARIGLAELLNSRELIFPGQGQVHAGVAEALRIGRAVTAEAPERGDGWLAYGWSLILSDDAPGAGRAASIVAELSQSNPRRLSAAAEMLALSGDVTRAARLADAASRLDGGVCRVSMGYRTPVALLAGDLAQAMALAEQSEGAIPFTFAYGAAAAHLAGETAQALRFWARFREGLAARWQGDSPPDPRGWFLAATSMRWGLGLDEVAGALSCLTGAPAPVLLSRAAGPAARAAQRQDRVV
ncbi:MAG: hypothetical protein JNN06_14995 [Gemmobacter sp.]|uniref:BTAD domain-containing putative transcriptional regulator n=1 Tax=Gemmobacter sp. TaxID=1898957 RepID=UPI001A5A4B41|nr:BTAD domain-containing putative transcriptional regulator [Gemmobacter sp.]MBL8563576.1 hypothetical protein [Gemmobacter sp.]